MLKSTCHYSYIKLSMKLYDHLRRYFYLSFLKAVIEIYYSLLPALSFAWCKGSLFRSGFQHVILSYTTIYKSFIRTIYKRRKYCCLYPLKISQWDLGFLDWIHSCYNEQLKIFQFWFRKNSGNDLCPLLQWIYIIKWQINLVERWFIYTIIKKNVELI